MTPRYPRRGQFGVVRTAGFVPAMIRLMTRSQVNHAFIFTREDCIVEAEGVGARHARPSEYAGHLVAVSDIPLSNAEAQKVADAAERLVGTPYGFVDIAAIALRVLGLRWRWLAKRVQREDRLICSQLVDRAYRNAGINLYDDGRLDGQVTPGDLLMLLATNGPIKVSGDEEVLFG